MRRVRTLIIALCIAAACAQQGDGPALSAYDDAEAREAWELLASGAAAPDYLGSKQEALLFARQQEARTRAALASAAPAWRSIGPFRGTTSYGSMGGRLRTIV